MSNPILIHQEKCQGQAFGDPRRLKRGPNYMQRWHNSKV
jgi:hypothetical protein